MSSASTPFDVCILAIPSDMTLEGLCEFASISLSTSSTSTNPKPSLLRIENPSTLQVSVIIAFSTTHGAQQCLQGCRGRRFQGKRTEFCYIVPLLGYRLVDSIPARIPEHFRLPSCPMCLERLDISASGIVPLVCDHSFSCDCVSCWDSLQCLVCSLVKSAETGGRRELRCEECASENNLWVCLVCAHIGCNRFHNSHAISHYDSSGHRHSLHLVQHRVWDYGDDGYIHRLFKTSASGSATVTFKESAEETDADIEQQRLMEAKVESLIAHYNSMMANQLQKQYVHFEEEMEQAQQSFAEELEKCRFALESLEQENNDKSRTIAALEKKCRAKQRKIQQHQDRMGAVEEEIAFTMQLNQTLVRDQKQAKEVIERRAKARQNDALNELARLEKEVLHLREEIQVEMENLGNGSD